MIHGIVVSHPRRVEFPARKQYLVKGRAEVNDQTLLRNKLVFRIKASPDGTLRYKAGLVVKGYK